GEETPPVPVPVVVVPVVVPVVLVPVVLVPVVLVPVVLVPVVLVPVVLVPVVLVPVVPAGVPGSALNPSNSRFVSEFALTLRLIHLMLAGSNVPVKPLMGNRNVAPLEFPNKDIISVAILPRPSVRVMVKTVSAVGLF